MGKGNREQNERASATLATAKSGKKTKKGLPVWAGTLILVTVLVALVLIAMFSALSAKGVFLHGKTVASTEHYEVNAAMMSYVIYSEYQNFVSQYSSSSYGNILQYIRGTGGDSLSTSKGLRSQYYSKPTEKSPETATMTWFDYFAKSAENQVTQVLTYCEIANYYGVTLDADDYATIDNSINTMTEYAKTRGYSANEYLMAMYGKGVTVKEVRRMMELSQLSSKMANIKQEEFENGVVEVRIDEEYAANHSKYDLYTGYIGYTFTAEFKPEKEDNKDGDFEEYEKLCNEYKTFVESMKAITDPAEFRTKISGFIYDRTYKKTYDEEIAKETGEEEAKKKATEAADKASADATLSMEVPHHKKGDDTNNLDTWLYDAERKIGDITTIMDENAAKNDDGTFVDKATSTFSVYLMTALPHVDNGGKWRSVGHILFKSDTYDKMTTTEKLTGKVKELADKVLAENGKITSELMANALLAQMLADGKITVETEGEGENAKTVYKIDKNAFEEYGKIYNEDSNIFYTDVKPGDMVEEFEKWLMDASRVVGEISYPNAVKTKYGYHIMTYTGDEKIAWRSEIKQSLADTDFENWYKAEKEKITVTVNSKAIKSISG